MRNHPFRRELVGLSLTLLAAVFTASSVAGYAIWGSKWPTLTGTSGCTGGIYIEDGATHEFGHVLGLWHSDVGDATMYPTTGYCSQNWRSLHSDDIAGIEAIYPASSTAPPAAPANVGVSVSSASPASALVVSWADQSASEDGFRVERSMDGAYWASPANGATNVNVDADLAWGAVSGATGYDVYFGASSSPGLVASNVTSPSMALATMPAGVKHYWRVVARNAYGATSGSVWSFTTKAVKVTGKPPKK